jgi:hypothetical protein
MRTVSPLAIVAACVLCVPSRASADEPEVAPVVPVVPVEVAAPPIAPDVAPAQPAVAPARPWTGAATLGVVSLPRVLSLEALVLKRRAADPRFFHFGFGGGVEYLPKGLAAFGPKTDFSWLQFGVDGRFFPWRWAFVGARLGWQFSRADSEKFGSEVDYITTSFFFAPKIGILHSFANGFTIGGDFGATIPIGADTELQSDATEDSGARKASKTFGAFVMPFASLFRIGYTL